MTTSDVHGWRAVMRRRWFKPVVFVLVSLIVGWFILRFIGKISWPDVADAVRSVTAKELAVLLVLLLFRQAFNAVPIARFTPGLGLRRALASDLSANLTATFAPPPSDIVVRVAQFRTWGVNPVDGMAGATLNTLIFYGARFAAPALGAALFSIYAFDTGRVVTGVLCLAIAAAIIGVLVSVLQSDAMAEKLARHAARAARAIGAKVEAQKWVDAVVDFRQRIGRTLNRNLVPGLAFMLLGIIVDGIMLLAAVRFVGIGSDVLPSPVIVGAMLLAYPFTILPAFGLGVMDALVIASMTEVAGVEYESTLIGATMVWRVVTLFGPLAMGAIAMGWWRAASRRRENPAPASDL